MPEDLLARLADSIPVRRTGRAHEIGDLCAYLCSPQAASTARSRRNHEAAWRAFASSLALKPAMPPARIGRANM
jgi:hypothetical protein